MKNHLKAVATCVLVSAMATAQAQTTQASGNTAKSTTRHRTTRKVVKKPSVQTQIEQLRQDMETQINQLKQQLSDSNSQLQAAQSQAAAANAAAAQAQQTAQQQTQQTADNTTAVSNLQGAVTDLKANSTSLASTIQETQTNILKKVDNPDSIHYKGITLSPTGSFLAAETVWRQRATASDIPTPFNALPFEQANQAKLSEFYGTGRQSRVALTAEGKLDNMTLRGYYEADWLGTGPTSNNNQSNSYTFRQRQLWAQAALNSGLVFTGGQMWSLVTETKTLLANKTEALPQTIDPNYVPGFNWTRQYGFRVVQNINNKFAVGISAENPETLNPGGSNLPLNYVLGAAGNGGGLYNNAGTPGATNAGDASNYSFNVAPDLIAKAAADTNFGHYEIYGLARFYRNRVYPNYVYTTTPVTVTINGVKVPVSPAQSTTVITGSAAGAYNDKTVGGGVGGALRIPTLHKHLDVGVKGLWGDGVGRYGDSTLPDLTIRPNGQLALLHGYSALGTLELHATPRFDIYANYGIDGTMRRYFFTNASNTAAEGYGSYLFSNAGCGTEPAPAALPSAGFSPSAPGSCAGNTRDVQEATIGTWYDFYKGPKGRLRQGLQYAYATRQTWSGLNGIQPKAINNMFWTSFRYYLP